MKKVLIFSGSPRRGGNCDILCDEFLRGALEAGAEAEKIFVREKKLHPCNACYYCREHDGRCVFDDGMNEILDKIMQADVLVFSSPVYFYSIDAQMKTLIDRFTPIWMNLRNKEMYYIMTAAEDTEWVMDCTLECFRGLAKCLKNSVEKGVIEAKGVRDKGDVVGTVYMQQAYEMGKLV